MLLVQATLTFADGTTAHGFITPQHDQEPFDLGIIQPQVFSPTRRHDFWDGMFQRPGEDRAAFYRDLNKTASQVFPVAFATKPGLASGHTVGKIEGFYVREKRRSAFLPIKELADEALSGWPRMVAFRVSVVVHRDVVVGLSCT